MISSNDHSIVIYRHCLSLLISKLWIASKMLIYQNTETQIEIYILHAFVTDLIAWFAA
jgi:hypothetical protein